MVAEKKEKKENKENKILTILTKEYKYEGLILLLLSLIAIVLGILIIIGENTGTSGLVIKEDVFNWRLSKSICLDFNYFRCCVIIISSLAFL